MKFVSLGVLAALLGTAGVALAQDLRIGSSADYPPWESTDPSGEIVGFDRDFADELCKRIEMNCNWSNQAYDGLLPSLQIGKYDALISAMSINEERARMVDFTIAYADAPNVFVTLNSSALGEDTSKDELIASVSNKTIGVQSGTTHEQVLAAHFPDATVRSYERPDQVADDLRAGRIDAGLMEQSAWQPFLTAENSDLKRVGPAFTSADYAEFGQGQGIALKKGNTELKDKMDVAITEMLNDGTLVAMSEKWFGYDLSSKR